MMGDHFYTYMLIDPRNGSPFYVGKGQRNRCDSHVKEARSTKKNSAKLNKIRKIESLGMDVVVKKVLEHVSDEDAKDFEMLIIAECRDKGTALTNITDGGDGSAGYRHSYDSKRLISAAQRGVRKPDSQRKKLSAYLLSNPIIDRPGVREKVSGENHWAHGKTPYNKGVPMSPEVRAKLSAAMSGENHPQFGRPCTDERREAIRAATTGVKKSTTVNMRKPRRIIQCPHCGKEGGANTMHRWHFDNCKEVSNGRT